MALIIFRPWWNHLKDMWNQLLVATGVSYILYITKVKLNGNSFEHNAIISSSCKLSTYAIHSLNIMSIRQDNASFNTTGLFPSVCVCLCKFKLPSVMCTKADSSKLTPQFLLPDVLQSMINCLLYRPHKNPLWQLLQKNNYICDPVLRGPFFHHSHWNCVPSSWCLCNFFRMYGNNRRYKHLPADNVICLPFTSTHI